MMPIGLKFKIRIGVYKFSEDLFGKRAVRRYYLNYCIKVYLKHRIIFIHIPRTGGTSITRYVYGRRSGHFYASDIVEQLGLGVFNELVSFAVTRNPYDRLVSAYEYIKHKGGREGGVRFEREFSLPAFADFESFVKDWLIYQNKEKVNMLFRPQYLFIFNYDLSAIVHNIFKLEDQSKLKNFLGNFSIQTPFEEKLNSSKRVDICNYYNLETKQLVYEFYKMDFNLLNYCK